VRGEGKSTIVSYLATTMGLYPGRRILAMDFDFRIPTLHKNFNIKPRYGLDQVLAREIPAEKALVETELPSLSLAMPRAKADFNLLLRTQELADLIAVYRERFDLILIDSPAIVPVPDATMLMPLADAVLIAVMAGKTTETQLLRAKEICEGMDMNVLGMIVGNVQEAAPEYLADEYDYHAYANGNGGEAASKGKNSKSKK
jgi:Mrp family chromosome partitioning ATPase